VICDELGYLPLLAEGASAIFQVVSRRAEQGSMIVTTNRNIASWGEIFSDSIMAAAILDRFPFRATLLAINGDSYRMRAHRERLQMLREG
jgi:DNA replication protein DnaC